MEEAAERGKPEKQMSTDAFHNRISGPTGRESINNKQKRWPMVTKAVGEQLEDWCGLGLYFVYCPTYFPGRLLGLSSCCRTKAMLGPIELRPWCHWPGKCPGHLEFSQDSQVVLKCSQVSRPPSLTMYKNRALKRQNRISNKWGGH